MRQARLTQLKLIKFVQEIKRIGNVIFLIVS